MDSSEEAFPQIQRWQATTDPFSFPSISSLCALVKAGLSSDGVLAAIAHATVGACGSHAPAVEQHPPSVQPADILSR